MSQEPIEGEWRLRHYGGSFDWIDDHDGYGVARVYLSEPNERQRTPARCKLLMMMFKVREAFALLRQALQLMEQAEVLSRQERKVRDEIRNLLHMVDQAERESITKTKLVTKPR